MVEFWRQQLIKYGNHIDHDPTEYFIPRAQFIDVLALLVSRGYMTLVQFMDYELEKTRYFDEAFVLSQREILSFSDMMEIIGFECDGDWDKYPSLNFAAEYLASNLATEEERTFYSTPAIWDDGEEEDLMET